MIDLTEQQNAIKRKYGDRYWDVPDAQREIAALWGVTPDGDLINDHGVFLEADESFSVEAGSCQAEAEFVQAPNGKWLFSTGSKTPSSGHGGPLSVWDRRAYDSFDEARLAAIDKLKDRFRTIETCNNSCTGGAERRDARAMQRALDHEKEKAQQLSLF